MGNTHNLEIGDVIKYETTKRTGLVGAVSAFLGDDVEVRRGGAVCRVKRCRITDICKCADIDRSDWAAFSAADSFEARKEWGLIPAE